MTAQLGHESAALGCKLDTRDSRFSTTGTRSDKANASPRIRRGRLFVLMWAAVYPLVLGVGAVLHAILPPSAPHLLVVLVTSGVLVAAMMFLIAPAIIRLFAPWLSPPQP